MKRSLFILMLIVVYMLYLRTLVVAGSVPYTFTAGTTAKSAEVNANFEYINYGNIIVKDGNGSEIGTLIGRRLSAMPVFDILNYNGYIVGVRWDNGEITDETHTLLDFSYEGTDCSGTGYTYVANHPPGSVLRRSSGELFYIDKNAIKSTKIMGSYYLDGVCGTGSYNYEFYQLTPNDSSVTGISSANFATPIIIERR
ncbi:MAG: hypothetical protein L3V56_13845 [Candidatus Magnetoovum sp. WYHC-5]|nr:hypothetical protein [Candidatus Magnetoovum sp. WYHC-5]